MLTPAAIPSNALARRECTGIANADHYYHRLQNQPVGDKARDMCCKSHALLGAVHDADEDPEIEKRSLAKRFSGRLLAPGSVGTERRRAHEVILASRRKRRESLYQSLSSVQPKIHRTGISAPCLPAALVFRIFSLVHFEHLTVSCSAKGEAAAIASFKDQGAHAQSLAQRCIAEAIPASDGP